jgi:hypothetical protein
VVRDLAAFAKRELPPWDGWGLMATREDGDAAEMALLDRVAELTQGEHERHAERLQVQNSEPGPCPGWFGASTWAAPRSTSVPGSRTDGPGRGDGQKLSGHGSSSSCRKVRAIAGDTAARARLMQLDHVPERVVHRDLLRDCGPTAPRVHPVLHAHAPQPRLGLL